MGTLPSALASDAPKGVRLPTGVTPNGVTPNGVMPKGVHVAEPRAAVLASVAHDTGGNRAAEPSAQVCARARRH